ncbi:MAG: hypothetical protein KA248_02455 [Kiritimatiellae bacterium]|nr:hypothetical protein [Kiritimatiellia bacterium]
MHEAEEADAPRPGRIRRIAQGLLLAALAAGLLVAGLELAYRRQWVDTYKPELRAYNPPSALGPYDPRETVVILGDSFTAGWGTYPDLLRERLPYLRIVNAGVPGTGIAQARLIARRRLAQFPPRLCIYQLYAGNELFDLRYPSRGEALGPARKAYWAVANRLRFASFLNYRLGQVRHGARLATRPETRPAPPAAAEAPFSVEKYDAREKLYLAAEPSLLEDQVLVRGERAHDYGRLMGELRELHALCRARGSRLALLVIPHACQVHPAYLDRMRQLGARFEQPDRMPELEYPFLSGLRAAFEGEADVEIIDALPDLQQAEARGETVYFQNDGHLNARGQRLVADRLAPLLEPLAGGK